MSAVSSQYSNAYNSFSGADMKVVFGSVELSNIQGLSYSITREKAPIYTMGSADPRSFSRGKRGIAGTIVFTVFDRHALLGALGGLAPDGGLLFQSDIDDIYPDFSTAATGSLTGQPLGSSSGVTPSDTVDAQESPITSVGGDQELARAWFADQIPPFDVSIAAANEYGHLAVMRVFGLEVMNEGSGISVDDIQTEQQHTYLARTMIPWTPVNSPNAVTIANQGGSSSQAPA
jgi:hypothetical protein